VASVRRDIKDMGRKQSLCNNFNTVGGVSRDCEWGGGEVGYKIKRERRGEMNLGVV